MAMKWDQLLKPIRFDRNGKLEEKNEEGRSPFTKDQDKIIFSSAFRRLSKKTQVHPMVENDHVHTRLTHSIEVASVGRSIANIVGAKISTSEGIDPKSLGEIVHAACLAHDIGNTPFGHAGEAAIQDWFSNNHAIVYQKAPRDGNLTDEQITDFHIFDGNAMGFRILTTTEYDTHNGGMRLSFPTLAATLKYPYTSEIAFREEKKKYCCMCSERKIMNQVCSELGMVKKEDYHFARHPLAFIVEAADDICNNILDIEDAREMGTISYDIIEKLFQEYHATDETYNKMLKSDMSERRKLAYIRGKTIQKLINYTADKFISSHDSIMNGTYEEPLIQTKGNNLDDSESLIKEANELCHKRIFNHPKKVEIEIGAYTAIGAMLDAYHEAASNILKSLKDPDATLSFKTQRILSLLGCTIPSEENEAEDTAKNCEDITRTLITSFTGRDININEIQLYDLILPFFDYLCGMTDHYATHISQQIMGKASNSIRN